MRGVVKGVGVGERRLGRGKDQKGRNSGKRRRGREERKWEEQGGEEEGVERREEMGGTGGERGGDYKRREGQEETTREALARDEGYCKDRAGGKVDDAEG